MAEFKNQEEVFTKVVEVQGTKGPYIEATVAGERFADKVFSKDAASVLKAGGPGTYQVTRLPRNYTNKKGEPAVAWNINMVTKVGGANPAVVAKAERKETKTGDDIRKAVSVKTAREALGGVPGEAIGDMDGYLARLKYMANGILSILKDEKDYSHNSNLTKKDIKEGI